jgi:hypothetical protein
VRYVWLQDSIGKSAQVASCCGHQLRTAPLAAASSVLAGSMFADCFELPWQHAVGKLRRALTFVTSVVVSKYVPLLPARQRSHQHASNVGKFQLIMRKKYTTSSTYVL